MTDDQKERDAAIRLTIDKLFTNVAGEMADIPVIRDACLDLWNASRKQAIEEFVRRVFERCASQLNYDTLAEVQVIAKEMLDE